MKAFSLTAALLLTLATSTLRAEAPAAAPEKEEGFTPLFNGKDLSNWEGDDHWSVKDGAIRGEATKETMVKGGNTFLTLKGENGKPAEFGDFELRCTAKLVGGNSGIQYRSFTRPEKFVVGGYQMEICPDPKNMGKIYGELYRGQIAAAGDKTVFGQGGKKTEKLEGYKTDSFKKDDWNEYRIVCRGHHIEQYINGVLTVDLTDETKEARTTGLIALQIHQGYVMTIEVKDIRIKTFAAETKAAK